MPTKKNKTKQPKPDTKSNTKNKKKGVETGWREKPNTQVRGNVEIEATKGETLFGVQCYLRYGGQQKSGTRQLQ